MLSLRPVRQRLPIGSLLLPPGGHPAEDGRCSVKTIPVVLRQSDRLRAIRLTEDLKSRIINGSFRMAEPVERIG